MKSSVVTIKELSHISGYSVSTVSKALNNKKDVNIRTKNLIKKIAKESNYVPNNYAVALRVKKTKSIAIVLPNVITKHFNEALFYLQQSAEAHGYRVLLFQTLNSIKNERSCLNRLNDGTLDGAILLSCEKKKNLLIYGNKFPLLSLRVDENHSLEEIEQLSNMCILDFLKISSKN